MKSNCKLYMSRYIPDKVDNLLEIMLSNRLLYVETVTHNI